MWYKSTITIDDDEDEHIDQGENIDEIKEDKKDEPDE